MDVSSVAELTVDELKNLIRETVAQTIVALFSDPDAGLELQEEFQIELQRSLEAHSLDAVRAGKKNRSAQEVANSLGFEW